MSSSISGAEGTLTSPTEQQANALVETTTMDAKLMVATGSGNVQQLKDLVKEEESQMMVVVMAKHKQHAASVEKPQPQQGNMDPHLLARLASSESDSSEELKSLLISREESQASGHGHGGGTDGGLTTRHASASSHGDTEANESILEGVTAEGDTALHVVAVASGYCNGNKFLESACIIYGKGKHLLFVQNNKGDTPLHCAARAGKSNMVACLIDLALAEGEEDRMKELLRKENKHNETALHEAVRLGNKEIVDLLMEKDSELASFPEDGGASPMYVAIMLKREEIVKTLCEKSSDGKLSFSGPNGQNALHAAVLRHRDLTELLIEWNTKHLRPQNKDLTTQRDENGSTPLHFAAAMPLDFAAAKFLLCSSTICRQVLNANPEALYQPDHAGFSPIHAAASVDAFWNVMMFVKKYPRSAGLRDVKGRTFLHVAVEKKKVAIIWIACRCPSLSWIMNMVDNDGNTALHLAVKAGSLLMFCPLLGNPQVNLNLPNNRGETPLDIAQYKIFKVSGLYHMQSSEEQILLTLRNVGAVTGVCRGDHFKDVLRVKVDDESKEMEVLKDTTGTLCIGSVLIATVTFGVTFAVPGGYIADDHDNGGSPILARRYAFDAFIASNTLAFVFSTMATIGLMNSGSPLLNPRSRKVQLSISSYLVSISITCLAAAFALGGYVVLAPVAHKTAVATCVLGSLVMLYENLGFIGKRLLILPTLRTRKGPICAWVYSAFLIMDNTLFLNYWPLIFIFGWAAHASPAPKIQAPAPSA